MPWLWQVVLGPSPSLLGTQYIHLKIHLQWRGSLEPICLVQISGLPLTVTLTNLWHPRASDKVVMTGTRRLLQGLAVIIVTQTALLCIWVFLFYFVGREELAAKTDHWLILRLKASPLRSWTCPILELCNWLVNLEAKTWNCIFSPKKFQRESERAGGGGWGKQRETEMEQIETASLASGVRALEKAVSFPAAFFRSFFSFFCCCVCFFSFLFVICVHTSPSCGSPENYRCPSLLVDFYFKTGEHLRLAVLDKAAGRGGSQAGQ